MDSAFYATIACHPGMKTQNSTNKTGRDLTNLCFAAILAMLWNSAFDSTRFCAGLQGHLIKTKQRYIFLLTLW
jgi:hypothetical protein